MAEQPKIGRSAIPAGMSLPPDIDADAAADFIRGAKVTAGQVSMPAAAPAPAPAASQPTKPQAATPAASVKRLFVTGRLPDRIDRRKVALGVLQPLWDEVESLCMGGDQAVLNYLIREGLKAVRARTEPIMLDAEDLGDQDGEG